jgi:hypothetical protein
MKHLISHDLGLDLALRATSAALASYAARYPRNDPKYVWDTPTRVRVSFQAKGRTIEGVVEVQDRNLEINMTIPLLFRMFESSAAAVVEKEIKAWAAKAHAGQI